MAVFDTADGLGSTKEHTVVNRHLVRKAIDRLGSQTGHKHVVVALPNIEIAAVVDAKTPVFVVSARRKIHEHFGTMALGGNAEVITAILRPEKVQYRFESIIIEIFLFLIGNLLIIEYPLTMINIVKLDQFARYA